MTANSLKLSEVSSVVPPLQPKTKQKQRRFQKSLAITLCYSVLLVRAVALVATSLDILPSAVSNIVQAVTVLALPVFALKHNSWIKHTDDSKRQSTGLSILIFLSLLMPMISVGYNIVVSDASLQDSLRVVFFSIHCIGLLLIYPLLFNRLDNIALFFYRLVNFFIFICLGLLTLTVLFTLSGHNPYPRIGYPMAPGVFAFYMVIAWLITYTVRRNYLLNGLFFVATVAAGSRSALFMLFFLMMILSVHSRRSLILVVFVTFVGLFVATSDSELLRPFTHEREDVSSGRLLVWTTAYNELKEHSMLLGFGTPQQIAISVDSGSDARGGEVRELGTHNAFMDASMTYGIPFAITVISIWFIAFFPGIKRYTNEQTRTIYQFQVALLLLVTIKSVVTNTFWTNMGDSATFFAALILLCPTEKIARFHLIENDLPEHGTSHSTTKYAVYNAQY